MSIERNVLEQMAKVVICESLYYELLDCMDDLSDFDLFTAIQDAKKGCAPNSEQGKEAC